MIPDLRRDFNQRFTRQKYAQFLSLVNERSGTEVKFRLCETPCFFPADLIETMQQAGKELIHQLVDDKPYLDAAREEIPKGFLAPNETKRPLYLQVDFGLIRDESGSIAPRLVEIQAFPSLYAMQPVVEDAYRDVYKINLSGHEREDLFRRSVLGAHAPENVVLLEIDPLHQKTLPDFLLTERICGIHTVDIRNVRKRGNKLYHDDTPIHRIYNRAIADELIRRNIQTEFRFDDDLDVEWAGHPNWFFLISKFSLPYLKHETVPECWFLDRMETLPDDLENYVLKPLYSFAGLGVKVGPTREDVDAIPPAERSQYLLQRRMRFEPVIETPFGPTQAEIRVMYIWPEAPNAKLEAVSLIVRMGRGKMMGVDHNRDMEWVGASSGFVVPGGFVS
jgi:hypothetical protein